MSGLTTSVIAREVAQFAGSVAIGTVIGGVSSVAMGGTFGEGAMWGAIGGAVGYGVAKVATTMMKPSNTPKPTEAEKQDALNTDKAQLRPPKPGEKFTYEPEKYGDSQYPNLKITALNEDGQTVGTIHGEVENNILRIPGIHVDQQYRGGVGGTHVGTELYGQLLKAAGPNITEIHGTPGFSNMGAIQNPQLHHRIKAVEPYGFTEHFMRDNVLISRRPLPLTIY